MTAVWRQDVLSHTRTWQYPAPLPYVILVLGKWGGSHHFQIILGLMSQSQKADFAFKSKPNCFQSVFAKVLFRDGWRLQNRWNFGKVPNGLWPPPLIFGKSCCNFLRKMSENTVDSTDQTQNYRQCRVACIFFGASWDPGNICLSFLSLIERFPQS